LEKVVVINLTSKDTIDNEILATVLERLESIVRQMAPVSSEYDDRHQSEVLGDLLDRIDITEILEEARTGGVERTAERVDSAIQRATDSKRLQDDILSNISTLEGIGWKRLGAFTTKDLANFISRAAALLDIEVLPLEDPERFDLRLPEFLKGRFSEFGNRTLVECRTGRDVPSRFQSRIVLDFSSSIVRYLVDSVTRAEFGGGFGVVTNSNLHNIVAAVLVHYQNEQGDPRGVDLLAGARSEEGKIVVDNGVIRPLFECYQNGGLPTSTLAEERKSMLDAVLDRIEVEVASNSEVMRHANGIFAIGIVERSRPD